MTDAKTNVPFREGKPISSAPAMAEEIKRLRAENERLTERVEWFTHAVHTCHDECDRPLCKTTRERDALRAELERKDVALRKLIEACTNGRLVSLGASGMTIEAQFRNSVYNGVNAWAVAEAEEALDALSAQKEGEAAMSDIVERLRNGYPCLEGGSDHTCRVRNAASGCLCATAADTITRLRAEVERLQSEAYEYATTCRAIPDEFALVPPDGGDVKPWEAVSDMANTITRYREALTILSDHWKHGYGGPSRADVIRAVEDTARAALTAQEKTDGK